MESYKISAGRIAAAFVVTIAAGTVLRYFELDTFIIILGFRFHLSAVLPFLIIYNSKILSSFKKEFVNPEYKRKFLPLVISFVPLLVIVGGLYLSGYAAIGDPDYFYELGLSSIADYPLYLFWNLPQLMLIFLLLKISVTGRKRFLLSTLLLFLLFLYEVVPLPELTVGEELYFSLGELIITAAAGGIVYSACHSIYWFGTMMFTLIWGYLLAFGSAAEKLIHIFLAARFDSWEGFFTPDKVLAGYVYGIYIVTAVIILIAACRRPAKVD